jgi:hypothetical protein
MKVALRHDVKRRCDRRWPFPTHGQVGESSPFASASQSESLTTIGPYFLFSLHFG